MNLFEFLNYFDKLTFKLRRVKPHEVWLCCIKIRVERTLNYWTLKGLTTKTWAWVSSPLIEFLVSNKNDVTTSMQPISRSFWHQSLNNFQNYVPLKTDIIDRASLLWTPKIYLFFSVILNLHFSLFAIQNFNKEVPFTKNFSCSLCVLNNWKLEWS